MLQSVAECCSVLQSVAVCCSEFNSSILASIAAQEISEPRERFDSEFHSVLQV